MSGFVALVRFDDAPLDRVLFEQLAESLRFRGPDRQTTLIFEHAAFAHALLITAPEMRDEVQPRERDGIVFTGDVRIDEGGDVLDAYERHGDDVARHLVGDFSFVIYDVRQRRLLAVRDRFARRPLYYAWHRGALLVTNNLPTLLAVAELASELDEFAIGDFLLFGRNLHPERTTYARISRVPAARQCVFPSATMTRYWSLPEEDEPRKTAEIHEEFREIFARAVADRARADRVVISLSGGLDSNAVAATLTRQRTHGVSAITTVFSNLFRDDEGHYAQLAADAYGIPLEIHAGGHCEPFERWDDPHVRGLEPTDEPCSAPFYDFLGSIAQKSRVVLTGEGGDPMLYSSHDYFFRMLRRFQLLRFARESLGYAITRRRRPPLNVRSQLLRALGRDPAMPDYPTWLDPEFEKRLGLRERWREIHVPRGPRHGYRNEAWRILDSASWSRSFEGTDAGSTGVAVEWLSPWLDQRLAEFLFSIPPMPHFANKDLVREAMRGWIPEAVRLRPKTPLPADPAALGFAASASRWASIVQSNATTELSRFVSGRILASTISANADQYGRSQQAFAVGLGIWLSRRSR
jgi:asparagine synthase (glutamine-hydrolysing)